MANLRLKNNLYASGLTRREEEQNSKSKRENFK